jgi:hypothetical protein
MRYLALIGAIFATSLLVASPSSAQSLLQRLEKRLGDIAERAAEAGERADQRAPAGDASAPADREPGYLGVIVDQEENGGEGVRVLTVKPGSAADKAGLRDGDLIVAINGRRVGELDDMGRALRNMPAGARISVKAERQSQQVTVEVTLGRRPAEETAGGAGGNRLPAPAPREGAPLERELQAGADAAPRPSLGITVTPVTEASRERYGLNVSRGAMISSVRSGSPADRAGLPLGAVIVALDGTRIDSPDDLATALGRLQVGDRVELAYYEGDRLAKKTVELKSSADVAPPALPRLGDARGGEPSLQLGRGVEDRPLLGRLERALEGFVQPPEGAAPPAPGSEVERLRQEVESLRRHISRLEQRLETLEQKVGESR